MLVTVALLPTISIVGQLPIVLGMLSAGSDSITEFERRIAPLSVAVRGHNMVGYLSRSGAGELDAAEAADFYLTQYALVPVIVVNDSHQPLVVGNATLDPYQPHPGVPAHLVVLRHFGQGLVLLQSTD